jgi:CMP-2-keto-3-deoxyoctulosonic acid synthetase
MSDQLRNEYVAVVMSAELLQFCRAHDLPYHSADELMLRVGISDYEYGWLNAYVNIWDSLIEA